MHELEAVLETAVADAIDPAPVNYTSVSQAICRSQNGSGQCLCERGVWRHCHSAQVYGDMAIAVMALLKRAGIIPKR